MRRSALTTLKSNLKQGLQFTLFLFLCLAALAGSAIPAAAAPGSIFTTFGNGTTVNGNIYPSKADVYLNGGPQNENAQGLPDGTYYFQVTDPNGSVLLSTDAISCRQLQVTNGIVAGATGPACKHANGTVNNSNGGSIPVQLIPFNDTPNSGGEYKVWLTPTDKFDLNKCAANHGFCDSDSKTDNFKVQNTAHVKVCKFNDLDGNSTQNTGESLIPHWPITATGVVGGTVNAQTDDNGCVTFAVSSFTNGVQTVTLAETVLTGWVQTAPLDGSCAGVPSANNCSATGGVITLTVSPNDTVHVPDFGNTCASQSCGGASLVVTKTANPSLNRTFNWNISKSVDQTQINTSGSATFNYTVSVTHDNGTDSGWQVTGTIKVSNSTGLDISGVTVTDAINNGGSCVVDTSNFNGTVQANTHVDLPYTCTYGSAPNPGTNTATATWGVNSEISASGTASVDFAAASVNPIDNSITVTDTLGGSLGTVTSADSSPKTFNYSQTFTDPAGTCTTHPNTATFTTNITSTTGSDSKSVKVCVGAALTASKTATPAFNSSIQKSVDKMVIDTSSGSSATFAYTVTVTESGWTVSGNITVLNPNDWEDITANLTDALPGANCAVTAGTGVSIPRGSSVVVPYTCTFASAPAASDTNTATATWDPAAAYTVSSSASGSAAYTFGSLTVTDTFNNVTATLGTISAPAATTTYTDPHTVTAPTATCATYLNTAKVAETSQSSSQSVQVCGASNLSVSKTAAANFNSYITKSVDKTLVEQAGGTATFNYTVKVTESGWIVTGNIKVSNPNDWEAITATVGDLLSDSGGSCTVNSGNNIVTVPAGSSTVLPYSCTFASVPTASSGVNTATATWNAATYFTAGSSASGTANYAFTTLTVNDSFKGPLGTVTVPPGSATFTYSRMVNNAVGGQCLLFPNTATITETGKFASQTVTICNTATGALTMGFWQNKNGQGIISSGASTGGVCNSGTFLRTFAPFQDLSSTATCTQVGTYVTNIIKAANASGSSMNAMLKAQMLATALDVFFSDPTLGSNKINAPTPIGTVKIDLTQVCAMIDGSSGGSCSGAYQNAGSAFGGATSMTVLNILLFQNTVANAGGSAWYGQVKSIQQLAKNTFDAINNQVALIAP